MKLHQTTIVRPILTVGLALGVAGIATSIAVANDTPNWTPADPNVVGSISLFNASGTEVTSGSVNDPIAAFAVGGAVLNATDNAAALYAYTPVAGTSPAGWSGLQLTSTSSNPIPGAPAGLPTGPTASITSSSTTLAQYAAAYPSSDGVYELRLRSTAPGHTTSGYDAVAVEINGTTWSISDGIGGIVTDTSTAVTVTPANPKAGSSVTLTATVTPSDATGTVQFKDGATSLGAPVNLSGGVATITTKVTTAGSHTFSAALTAGTGFNGSTGSTSVSFAKATPTLTASVNPAKPKPTQKAKVAVTLKATGLTPTGVVKLTEGKKTLATGTLKNGAVTVTLPKLAKGKHTIKVSYAGSAAVGSATKTITVVVK